MVVKAGLVVMVAVAEADVEKATVAGTVEKAMVTPPYRRSSRGSAREGPSQTSHCQRLLPVLWQLHNDPAKSVTPTVTPTV